MDANRANVRFEAFTSLSAEEVDQLRAMAGPARALPRRTVICNEGDASTKTYLLVEGWAASSVALASGARQMIKVHLPGDLMGTPSLALQNSATTIFSLSPVVICPVEPKAIGSLFETNARLAALLFLISQEERVIAMDRLASLGQTDATQRLLTLLIDLHARLFRGCPGQHNLLRTPLTQEQLADFTGLTPVHLNRVLRSLREKDILKWDKGLISIISWPALLNLAELPERRLMRDPEWLPAARPLPR